MSGQVLTKEQFRAQFETRVEIAPNLRATMQVERELHCYTVYRLLDRLVLEDGEQFYIHARPEDGVSTTHPLEAGGL
jgi:hypothetical protein